jgi:lysophospholipase L1-like esterase
VGAVNARPRQPEPFIRGAPYPPTADIPYPRADPSDIRRLPADVWQAASVPVGVRLEMVGDAEAVDIAYRTTTGNMGYRGDGAGVTFSVWRGGRQIDEVDAELGDSLIRLRLGSITPQQPATIYLPEGMLPVVRSLTAVHGEIAPAPPKPRWLVYGDSTTQGWIASGPAQAWTAIAARKAGLDLVNLGYARSGRGEIASAEQMAALDAEVITLSYGTSCWSRVPHSTAMIEAGLDAFLDVLRQGHPDTPTIVMSPLVRPEGEVEPNRLGATLEEIRRTIELVTRWRIGEGDENLALLPGRDLIDEGYLSDGIYPGDEGHKRIAAAVAKYLLAAERGSLHELAVTTLDASDPEGIGADDRDYADLGAGDPWASVRSGPEAQAEESDSDRKGRGSIRDDDSTAPAWRRTSRPVPDGPLYRRSARAPAV